MTDPWSIARMDVLVKENNIAQFSVELGQTSNMLVYSRNEPISLVIGNPEQTRGHSSHEKSLCAYDATKKDQGIIDRPLVII